MARKNNFTSEVKNTPEGTVCWPVVFEPEIKPAEPAKGGKPGRPERKVYRCDIIFEADQFEALQPLNDLAWLAGEAAWGSDDSKWPTFKTRVIRETSEKNPNPQTGKPWDGYEHGKYFISCQSTFQPPLIDITGRTIIDPAEFYGGCKAIFAVNAYTYEYMGHGIKFGLVSILKTKEGKPFGAARPDPNQIFKQLIKPGATPGGAVAPGNGAPRRSL